VSLREFHGDPSLSRDRCSADGSSVLNLLHQTHALLRCSADTDSKPLGTFRGLKLMDKQGHAQNGDAATPASSRASSLATIILLAMTLLAMGVVALLNS
jgi:hypothetical protein